MRTGEILPFSLYKADGAQTPNPNQALPNGRATVIHTQTHHIYSLCTPHTGTPQTSQTHTHTRTPPACHTTLTYNATHIARTCHATHTTQNTNTPRIALTK